MNVTYKRHPMNKKRPAPTRVEDPTPQLLSLSEQLTAFAREARAAVEPLSALFAAIRGAAYDVRLHARHPEYHGGKPLAHYSLRTGAYVPVRNMGPIDGRDDFRPLKGSTDVTE